MTASPTPMSDAMLFKQLEERVRQLEVQVHGSSSCSESPDQKRDTDSNISEKLQKLNQQLSLLSAGREKIARAFERVGELEKLLEADLEGKTLSTSAKLEIFIAEEPLLRQSHSLLEKAKELSPILNSEHLKSASDLDGRLKIVCARHLQQREEIDKLVAEAQAVLTHCFSSFSYIIYKYCSGGVLAARPSEKDKILQSSARDQYNFIADVVEYTAPGVVLIEVRDTRLRDWVSGKPLTVSNGSGFIIDSDGVILTNAHVVTKKQHSSLIVKLQDGREFTGRVEFVDRLSDLATVRIPCKGLPTLSLGESSKMRPGEWVVAMGSPLTLNNTITVGVISSVNRGSKELGLEHQDIDYIQTDAAITFGNSGGPLVNLDGEVIGINAMKVTEGISFAIPSDHAKQFIAEIAARKAGMISPETPGRVASGKRYVGITMITLTPNILRIIEQRGISSFPSHVTHGVLVFRVIQGSPARRSGLQNADIITHINGTPLYSASDVNKIVESGKELRMSVVRGKNVFEVTVLPEES
ncbi:unnamed protein product [Darwinula stevensoni]|uniref:Serine protease HTRA2, mitochondrial n=1 Tax=Darwinula stevensoni TaxID=69355 RepID=A0A7R9A4P3_9CRUS|nr:unnamed protein product [Darwinula stevensoni]CAG0893962.1 unnamed protein product [Darwinula stevensoni]